MRIVADTIGVARSNLHEQLQRPVKSRGPYRKPEDVELLPAIRQIVDERPSYGYRRITAVLNRQLRATGSSVVNRHGIGTPDRHSKGTPAVRS